MMMIIPTRRRSPHLLYTWKPLTLSEGTGTNTCTVYGASVRRVPVVRVPGRDERERMMRSRDSFTYCCCELSIEHWHWPIVARTTTLPPSPETTTSLYCRSSFRPQTTTTTTTTTIATMTITIFKNNNNEERSSKWKNNDSNITNNNNNMMDLLVLFGSRLVLEVFGGGGAIWGFSEAVGLRTAQTVWFWRPAALAMASLFFARWLLQVRDAILLGNSKKDTTTNSAGHDDDDDDEESEMMKRIMSVKYQDLAMIEQDSDDSPKPLSSSL